MTTGVMKVKAKSEAILNQLTTVSLLPKYMAALSATGANVSH